MYWSHILFVIFFVAGNACVLEPKMALISFDKFEHNRMKSEQWTMVADMTIRTWPMCPLIISSWIFRPCIFRPLEETSLDEKSLTDVSHHSSAV
jgi:hypothetical protein